MSLLIDETELNQRLENCEVVYKRLGRGNGKSGYNRENGTYDRVPPFIKELIGGEVRAGRKASDVARDYGVSHRSVLNFSEARNSQLELKGSDEKLEANVEKVADSIRTKIIDRTTEKLLDALGGIDLGDKFKKDSPVNQSVVARNIATVLDKVEGKDRNNGVQNNLMFNIHVPSERTLADFGEPIRVIEKKLDK